MSGPGVRRNSFFNGYQGTGGHARSRRKFTAHGVIVIEDIAPGRGI